MTKKSDDLDLSAFVASHSDEEEEEEESEGRRGGSAKSPIVIWGLSDDEDDSDWEPNQNETSMETDLSDLSGIVSTGEAFDANDILDVDILHMTCERCGHTPCLWLTYRDDLLTTAKALFPNLRPQVDKENPKAIPPTLPQAVSNALLQGLDPEEIEWANKKVRYRLYL
jgi:hypothetical protein